MRDDSRELYKSREDTTLGHVLWGSGQVKFHGSRKECKVRSGGPRALERCGEPGLFQ